MPEIAFNIRTSKNSFYQKIGIDFSKIQKETLVKEVREEIDSYFDISIRKIIYFVNIILIGNNKEQH